MGTAELDPEAAPLQRVPAWRSRAFGLELELDFLAPAFPETAAGPGAVTRLRLTTTAEIEGRWPGDAEIVGEMPLPDGGFEMRVEHTPAAGYRVTLRQTGSYLVSPDAAEILCAPPAEPEWRWQRGLIGQVLPLASALRGYDVLHTSALSLDGRCVLLEGPPGSGKSSLALHLARLGAEIVAEDVAALALRGPAVYVHPGVAVVNLRADQANAGLPPRAKVIGSSDKTHVLFPRAEAAMPLAGFYILERVSGPESAGIARIGSPSPTELIGSAFVPYVGTPEMMLLRLEIASHIAQHVPVYRVGVDPGTGAEALARTLQDHISGQRA